MQSSSSTLLKQLAGGITTGDAVIQQYTALLDEDARDESFKDFDISESRVDSFLHEKVSVRCPQLCLWDCGKGCEMILIVSHGQATVERGFSVNKEVEMCNMQEGTVTAHRLIRDYVTVCGGVANVPITKELLNYAATARTRYRAHLEDERRKKEAGYQSMNKKQVEEELEVPKKKRKTL